MHKVIADKNGGMRVPLNEKEINNIKDESEKNKKEDEVQELERLSKEKFAKEAFEIISEKLTLEQKEALRTSFNM